MTTQPLTTVRSILPPVLAGLCALATTACRADVVYSIDDGTANLTVGIDPGEDMIWFNRFPVEPEGEVIDSVSVAYGRPGLLQGLNGLAVTILLYEDTNGGSPQDATLVRTVDAVVANANTNILNEYAFDPTEIEGDLLVGVIFRNTTGVGIFIGSLDTAPPAEPDRSFVGFGPGLDPGNLGAIPEGNFGSIESFGLTGNFLVRAHGVPIPAPGVLALLVGGWAVAGTRGRGLAASRRLAD